MAESGGFNLSDLMGLSEPLTKLIETVSSGIGKVYEPWHIKRMAKAKSKELELISGVVNDNLQLPTRYENGNITIDTTNANELVQRAQNRFLFQEMKKQQNIESVIAVAYSELEDTTSVNDTPVDSDWIGAFFDSVSNVSTEQMQVLWGKLLAGEVQHPGSFSLRTLNVLKNLTQNEANIFKEIAPFVLRCPGDEENTYEDYFLLANNGDKILEKYGIPFVKIMRLNEAGLICENSQIRVVLTIKANESNYINGIEKSIKIENMSEDGNILIVQHQTYILTEAGKEFLPILLEDCCKESSNQYLDDCLEEIKKTGLSFAHTTSARSAMSINIVKN